MNDLRINTGGGGSPSASIDNGINPSPITLEDYKANKKQELFNEKNEIVNSLYDQNTALREQNVSLVMKVFDLDPSTNINLDTNTKNQITDKLNNYLLKENWLQQIDQIVQSHNTSIDNLTVITDVVNYNWDFFDEFPPFPS